MSQLKHITLAMDLSMNSPGFAVVAVKDGKPVFLAVNTLSSNTKHNHGKRLIKIEEEIRSYIEEYNPEHFVREKGFSRFNNVTQILYKVMGISEYSIEMHSEGAIMDEIAVTSVKKLVTGNGKSTKHEVAEVVMDKFDIRNRKPFEDSKGKLKDDMTDALSVGYAFLIQKGYIEEELDE